MVNEDQLNKFWHAHKIKHYSIIKIMFNGAKLGIHIHERAWKKSLIGTSQILVGWSIYELFFLYFFFFTLDTLLAKTEV